VRGEQFGKFDAFHLLLAMNKSFTRSFLKAHVFVYRDMNT